MGATLLLPGGAGQNLIGATVEMHYRPIGGGARKGGTCNVLNANAGTVRYEWQAGDTDVPGSFIAEFVTTTAEGLEISFPNAGFISLLINEDVE